MTLKKAILILLAALFSLNLSAQKNVKPQFKIEKPNLDAIRAATYDRTSPYYYPRLMNEYMRNDTLMKLDKFRHLYFGYMFQEDYNPYRPVAVKSVVPDPSENHSLTRAECDSVISLCEQALDDNPFDLTSMMRLISALHLKGKNNLANIWQYKLNYILMTIASSGTGLDEENAWYVIAPQHEYVLITAMGHKVLNHLFYAPYFEYITINKIDTTSPEGYYFNIKTILDEYYRKYPEEE
ncbi:MAG: DUF4919 domain-containing protein [Paramuribaculum sp.]|nr:DUF4919 domain-containing protein [Paramuribaculum sp.]MDE5837163.1 DUF4919 domain-containing protein [Paramuribaculum sp.]